MAIRSYSDVPNRMVQIFLQEAGAKYDEVRGFEPFRRLAQVLDFFGNACAYCGATGPGLVEEHVIPRNRVSVGLHAWGNVVPACRDCNRAKAAKDWIEFALTRDPVDGASRVHRIEEFRNHYTYRPEVESLQSVAESLYRLADAQARGLIDFALIAAAPHLDRLHSQPPASEHDKR